MQIDNPFTNGEIKNYLLFYGSIVVIMILFFMATTLFHDVKTLEKKNFATATVKKTPSNNTPLPQEPTQTKFKLLKEAY